MDERPPPSVLGALWRFRFISVAIVILVALVSVGIGFQVQPQAQATTTIALVTPPSEGVLAPGAARDSTLDRYTAQRAAFITSDAVLKGVAKRLGRPDLTKLRKNIEAKPSSSANTVKITTRAGSGPEAVKVAIAVVAAYRLATKRDVARLTRDAVKSLDESADEVTVQARASKAYAASAANTLSQLAVRASEIQTSSALFGDGVEFVVAAREDAVSTRALSVRVLALGLILGLVIAATLAWTLADRGLGEELDEPDLS
jgi:succinoglycan biosynthesis transport protein ExoP